MSIQNRLNILFWIKKSRLKNGSAPLYARITVGGQRCEIATNREIPVVIWNGKSQLLLGKSPEAKEINNQITMIKAKLLNCQSRLEARNIPVTAELLKNEYTGVSERPRFLVEIISQHNSDVKTLLGKTYASGTWRKYETTKKHLIDFLQWKYKSLQFHLQKVNLEFITDFEFYLKSQKNLDINSVSKYMSSLRKVIRECVVKDWLDKDPFLGYKFKSKPTRTTFLTNSELQALHQKEFKMERLQLIKDIFLFSCYTGLAYIDISNLTESNVAIGIDGCKWIFTHRQKTDTASRIPLLPQALLILDKYADHPLAISRKRLLPVYSNQKVNEYLKEIATLCEIEKALTFHMARHTFATTVTLSNNVPIETVSKMLGHTKIQTTQLYAKILDEKVSNDMQVLKNKFQAPVKKIVTKSSMV